MKEREFIKSELVGTRCHNLRMQGCVIIAAALACVAVAQETRHEITKNSPGDRKPNSEQVPAVYAIPTQFERVLILRFKYDAELLGGLEQMVKENKIRNAVILAGAGSVRNFQVHQVSNRTLPSKNVFVKNPTGPADIASMNGYIMNGQIHAHITLADPDKAFGGHLESETTVFTFAAVTLGVLPDNLDLSRLADKDYR
jgi:predicted DNA-binding protein with PD1-like motif